MLFEDSTISPTKEILAYESLWAIDGATPKRIADKFKETKLLPSQLFEWECKLNDSYLKISEKVKKHLEGINISFSILVNQDFQYPQRLRHAAHPIELFYYRGNPSLIESKCISIVGARKASPDGIKRAAKVARLLVKEGYTIVSGLADGIDTAAMKAAIAAGGNVIGVIGTPLDHVYPKKNDELQERVAREYLLISQVPFYRYATEPFHAHKIHFPERNKTMSALSEGTVIVEASETSGTLTQARAAIAQNRKLFILNSCFTNDALKWPKKYEAKGAIRVREEKDLLGNLG